VTLDRRSDPGVHLTRGASRESVHAADKSDKADKAPIQVGQSRVLEPYLGYETA
jgi:hypothetical protein